MGFFGVGFPAADSTIDLRSLGTRGERACSRKNSCTAHRVALHPPQMADEQYGNVSELSERAGNTNKASSGDRCTRPESGGLFDTRTKLASWSFQNNQACSGPEDVTQTPFGVLPYAKPLSVGWELSAYGSDTRKRPINRLCVPCDVRCCSKDPRSIDGSTDIVPEKK